MQRVSLNKNGTVAVEFGLAAPLLLLLALATTDLVQLLRSQLRLDSAAVQVGQLVSQCNRITDPGDTSQFWVYAQRVMGDQGDVTGTDATGSIIVSAVFSQSGANRVAWQRRAGNAASRSSVGVQGGTATISEGLVVPTGQTLLVTEVFFPRDPWVLSASIMGGALPVVLSGTTLFMTRAPDAPSIQKPPTSSAQPDCTK